MTLLRWEAPIPEGLSDPVLVMGLDGWIDAGFGGARAMGALKTQIRTSRLLSFDTDELIDQRARRPTMRLVNGVNMSLKWPRLQMRHGRDRSGRDLLVLTGPEPDFRWHRFLDELLGVCDQLGVSMAVGLGAFPAPVPHTRPVSLSSTATTAELAERVGFLPGGFEIPAGMHAAIERAFAEMGKPAIGIWARVPHYVASMLYPSAAAALLEALARLTGLAIDSDELQNAAASARRQIDGLIENNADHIEMVRQLELQFDQGATPTTRGTLGELGDLPSGDELVAELEKYLRDQGPST